ncbi:hypothetical protein OIU81_03060 [Streptomyces sp. NBC_01454]|uniref:hypothetical protein n=1 Tax=Streptomyces sp. NBC_01454 TaxID=2975867 RepID=UPI002E3491B5|nr:hypothetical protein [Streptomyces sp. NBC_01454]
MSTGPWTVDSIAHALPHSELRAQFMREATFTNVRELPATLERWVEFIEDFEAGRDRLEHLRTLVRANGHPPASYTASLIDVTPDELRSAAADTSRRGAA